MVDNLKNIKIKVVNDYISSIDMSEINTDQMAEALREQLGEKPAIRLNYKSDMMLNEDGSEGKRVEKIESITVLFTIEKQVDGNPVYLPVEETFIIA